jgi:hypothetical protein
MGDSPDQVRSHFFSFILTLDINIAKKKRDTLGSPTTTDAGGFLVDVDIQEIKSIDHERPRATREEKCRDVNQFFHPAVVRDVNGRVKTYRACKLCL